MMRDFFALLSLPVRITISPDDVDEAWRSRTGETLSADLNEARRVLSDPFLRLEHWLELRSPGFSKSVAIDPDLMSLFSKVNSVLAGTDELLGKLHAASTELGKAVLTKSAISAQLNVQNLLADFRVMTDDLIGQFSDLERAADKENYEPGIATLGRMTFLRKWERECQSRLLDLIATG